MQEFDLFWQRLHNIDKSKPDELTRLIRKTECPYLHDKFAIKTEKNHKKRNNHK